MQTIPKFRIGKFNFQSPFIFAKDPLYFLGKGFETCGDTFQLKLFREFVVTRDPLFFKHVLVQNNKNYVKGSSSEMLRPVLGNGLLTSDGDFWLRQRRLVQPAFHRERLNELFITMGQITTNFMDEIELHRGKDVVDIDALMMSVTADIALKTLFGNITNEDKASIYQQINRSQKYIVTRVRRPYRIPLMAICGERQRFRSDLEYFNRLIMEFIQVRRSSGETKNDLLQLLLDSLDEETGARMTDRQIRDEAITMFAAGHETSATGLSWLLYELSKQPQIVTRLRQEAEIFDVVPTFEQLMRLPYTRQVVEEGLRLYPPAWTITRSAVGDAVINGYGIKAGSSLFMSIFNLHRNPTIWDNPLNFNPENFEAEKAKDLAKFNYMPFGAGPRVCIGQQFALMEMQLLLAAMIKRFTFEMQPDHRVHMHPQIVLKSTGGIRMFVR
jgi:cytochrome P450